MFCARSQIETYSSVRKSVEMRVSVGVLFLKSFVVFSTFNFGFGIVIETRQGNVRGQTEFSRGGRQFYAFYRIPYAEPPIGELRFEDPVPAKNWNGTLDATILPPPCSSNLYNEVTGQEDCLYLNVYTPKINRDTLLPVMVFVYGGKFMYGHALPNRYGPHYFMDKDIIIITFHYRLGPLGFLNTADEIMPGNYGLKDFVEVLRWVQRNIESYGGDKNCVTIAGGSSGAVTTSLALISPLTKGLFHRCISQSGYPFEMADLQSQRRMALKVASFTSCRHENISTSQQLKTCLKKLSTNEILENITDVYTFGCIIPALPFSATIENEKIPGAFLIDEPAKLLDRSINVPWLVGMNSDEGGMLEIFTYLNENTRFKVNDELEKNYRKYFPDIFEYRKKDNLDASNRKTDIIARHYFGDTKIGENHGAFGRIMTSIYSTRLRKSVSLFKGPKYVYYYDHRNEESFDKYYGNPTNKNLGVIHGDELISFFNWSEAIKPITKGTDLIVSEQMLNFWVNFATFGNPNGVGKEIWRSMESSKFNYLHIKSGELKMKTKLMEAENKLWEYIMS